jgi:4-aminobutyrate aminotransferase-like enzyme
VARVEQQISEGFATLCLKHPCVFESRAVLGGIATIGLKIATHRPIIARELFKRGVYCHSVSQVDPLVVKFFPPLVSDVSAVAELIDALDRFAADADRLFEPALA